MRVVLYAVSTGNASELLETVRRLGGEVAAAVRNVPDVPVPAEIENLVDQYLSALVAHDSKRLPLSKDVKYTENSQVIDLGDGFWKTVEGRGKYTHIWADPEFGQVKPLTVVYRFGGVTMTNEFREGDFVVLPKELEQ